MGFVDRNFVIKVLARSNPRQAGTRQRELFDALNAFDGKPVDSFYTAPLDFSRKDRRRAVRSSWRNGYITMVDPSTGNQIDPPPRPYDDADEQDVDGDSGLEAEDVAFELESDLQIALRKNLSQLEEGLVESDGGREQANAAGRTDILARDASGQTVVIELKAGEADHKAVGQILSYVGALMVNGDSVRGLLVASGFTDRARLAARAAPSVKLKTYRYRFTFEDA